MSEWSWTAWDNLKHATIKKCERGPHLDFGHPWSKPLNSFNINQLLYPSKTCIIYNMKIGYRNPKKSLAVEKGWLWNWRSHIFEDILLHFWLIITPQFTWICLFTVVNRNCKLWRCLFRDRWFSRQAVPDVCHSFICSRTFCFFFIFMFAKTMNSFVSADTLLCSWREVRSGKRKSYI